MTPAHPGETPELSRPLDLRRQPSGTAEFDITADAQERAALAGRLGLQALDELVATVRVTGASGGITRLQIAFRGRLIQTCVVSLEPVPATVEAEFEREFTQSMVHPHDTDDDIVVDPEEMEPPELVEYGIIDVGEILAEELSLRLDPFPRAPGTTFEGYAVGRDDDGDDATGNGAAHPFAELAKLRDKKR